MIFDEQPGAPEEIRGQRVHVDDMQAALGFAPTTFFNYEKQWTPAALSGAKTVIAWKLKPDDIDETTGLSRFSHLNSVGFGKLKGIIEKDRKGRYEHGLNVLAASSDGKDDHRAGRRHKKARYRAASHSNSPPRRRKRKASVSSEDLDNDDDSDELYRRRKAAGKRRAIASSDDE